MLLRDTIRLRILFSDSGFMDSVIFRHRVSVQPRFNDYDIMGHINNTLFFSFFDIGKVAYFERVWGGFMNWRSMGLVVAHAEADFFAPIVMDEPVAVETATVEIGHKSLVLVQRIVNPDTGQVKGTGRSVMVGFDATTGLSNPVLPECAAAIEAYEGREFTRPE